LDLLEVMFEGSKNAVNSATVDFQVLDGYESTATWGKSSEPGGYLVFRDVEMPAWEVMASRKVAPAPFAIVWTGKEQIWKNGYPWTWQVRSICLSKSNAVNG
jgi:hypothetical protein